MSEDKQKDESVPVHKLFPFRATMKAISNCKDNWENLIYALDSWRKPSELEREWLTSGLNFINLHLGELSGLQECVNLIFNRKEMEGELKCVSVFNERRKEWESFNALLCKLKVCSGIKEMGALVGEYDKGSNRLCRTWSHHLRAIWHALYKDTRKNTYALVEVMVFIKGEKKNG